MPERTREREKEPDIDISTVESWGHDGVIRWMTTHASLMNFALGEFSDVTGPMLLRLDTQEWLRSVREGGGTRRVGGQLDTDDLVRNFMRNDPVAPENSGVDISGVSGGAKQFALAVQELQIAALERSQLQEGIPDDPELTKQLSIIGARCSIFASAHARQALIRHAWASFLTLLVVTLNAVVGAAIFSTVSDESASDEGEENPHLIMSNERLRLVAAALSTGNAVAAAIKSALQLETVGERHRLASEHFKALVVRFDSLLKRKRLPYKTAEGHLHSEWADWEQDYQRAMQDKPLLSDFSYDLAKRQNDGTPSAGLSAPTLRHAPDVLEFVTGTIHKFGLALCCWWSYVGCHSLGCWRGGRPSGGAAGLFGCCRGRRRRRVEDLEEGDGAAIPAVPAGAAVHG
jgi:hypothetical protein